MSKSLHLAVFISGSGSNLQALIDACASPDFPAHIDVVVSNRPDAYGLKRAAKAGIPAITIDHKSYDSREAFEEALGEAIRRYPIDLICLAGFMRILTPEFIKNWEGKILNTHPSLLPKFGGEGMYGMHVHKAVLDAGETQSGATIHKDIAEVDKGPIIVQKTVAVAPDDTPESLAERVIEQEHIAYPEAVAKLAQEQS